MVAVAVPRLVLSGIEAGDSRSLLGLGLTLVLKRRGVHVSCAVRGFQSSQATYYRRITQRLSRTIDERLLHQNQILDTIASLAIGADLILIEGDGGLYDFPIGYGARGGSDASLAELIRTPVVVTLDATHIGETLGALAKGLGQCAAGFSVEGVVVSDLDESAGRTAHDYASALRSFDSAPFLGSLNSISHSPETVLFLRERGLWSRGLSRDFLSTLEQCVNDNIEVDRLLAAARSAPPLRLEGVEFGIPGQQARVGIADDPCFQPVFQDNLDILRRAGAELCSFSPLVDGGIPKQVRALYISSCHLREYGSNLSANSAMRRSIFEFYNSGGVIYSEGTGSAYLCEQFQVGDDTFEGAGVIPGGATELPSHPDTYVEVSLVQDSILGPPGGFLRGVSSRSWSVQSSKAVVHVARANAKELHTPNDGLSPGPQVFATFTNLHWGSNPSVAQHFVIAAGEKR